MDNWAVIVGAVIVAGSITVASQRQLEANRFEVWTGLESILRYDRQTGELASARRIGGDGQPLRWVAVMTGGKVAGITPEAAVTVRGAGAERSSPAAQTPAATPTPVPEAP